MRLLNVKTMKLVEFFEKSIPKYAILSHTWGEDEVTFRDFDLVHGLQRTSSKIYGCCTQGIADGYDYVWIDTCCIDKSSSAELSEAINSMFAWYARAEICYVYLSDVWQDQVDTEQEDSDFSRSRWFTRGWTLQELLAPRVLRFYNASWHPLGCLAKYGSPKKYSSSGDFELSPYHLGKIAKIPAEILSGMFALNIMSIAMRMSWASARETTRVEDMAYCLLGIFEIAMPMLYGEGTKAFMRLQEEIIKNEDDHSIFAWGFRTDRRTTSSCFASSPAAFAGCHDLQDNRLRGTHSGHVVMTNKGLSIEMSIIQLATGDYIGRLNSVISYNNWVCLAIPLVRHWSDENVFYRPELNVPQEVIENHFDKVSPKPIYISKSTPKLAGWRSGIKLSSSFCTEFSVKEVHPPNWDLSAGLCFKSYGEGFKSKDQTILLRCSDNHGEMFAIRVDYTFQSVYPYVSHPFLRPKTAKVWASPLLFGPSALYSRSLLELIVSKGDQLDGMMFWQEDLILKRVESCSVNGEIVDGFTRRLHLDGSERDMWKIDVVDVSDSYMGDDPVTHSLESEDGKGYSESVYNDSDSEVEFRRSPRLY